MAQFTPEQFQQLMAVITGQFQGAQTAVDRGHRRPLASKGFNRLDKFMGGEEKWKEWSFDFKIAVKAQSVKVERAMRMTERAGEMTMDELRVADVDGETRGEYRDIEESGGDLYQQLVMLTDGEAKMIVKSVVESDGYKAWGRLHAKYNKRTLARLMRVHKECMYPEQVRDISKLTAAILSWEEKWRLMMAEYPSDVKIPPLWRMAAFLEMCPNEVKEQVYLRVDEIGEDYETLKAKVVGWIANKVEQERCGPVAMDVGRVDEKPKQDDENEEFEGYDEVDAIGNLKCHQCGGWGHMRRDCHSKGKGKGKGKDGGKAGTPKGKGKGWAPAFGGKGKGPRWFQGNCYKCGEYGHPQWECPKIAAFVEQADEETVQCLETVWTIGEVGAMSCAEAEADVECTEPPPGISVGVRGQRGGRERHRSQLCRVGCPCDHFQASNEVNSIDGREMTRMAQLEFNEADVRKPLASARFVAKAGNGIWLDADGGYIENLSTGERMAVRVLNDVYVFDVELDDDTRDVVTLDSGAGCSVWPKGRHAGKSKMQPRKKGVGMVAANGTPIQHYGQRKVCFKGVKAPPAEQQSSGFRGQM